MLTIYLGDASCAIPTSVPLALGWGGLRSAASGERSAASGERVHCYMGGLALGFHAIL